MNKLNINLAPIIKNIEIISRSLSTSIVIGKYKSVFKGKGLEFESYRAYTPEDDASLIDWKASLRANETLVKEFIEERNIDVFFLLDVSSSMLYSSHRLLKIEYAVELLAALYYIVLKAGDCAGFGMFTDKLIKVVPPGLGVGKFYNLERTLSDSTFSGGAYDLPFALRQLRGLLKPHTIVIIISDFIGLSNGWEHSLKLASKEFELIGIMVRDPNDRTLPDESGNVVVEDPFSGQQLVIKPSKLKKLYERQSSSMEAQVKSAFANYKCDFISLQTDEHFIKPITIFFKKRAERLR